MDVNGPIVSVNYNINHFKVPPGFLKATIGISEESRYYMKPFPYESGSVQTISVRFSMEQYFRLCQCPITPPTDSYENVLIYRFVKINAQFPANIRDLSRPGWMGSPGFHGCTDKQVRLRIIAWKSR